MVRPRDMNFVRGFATVLVLSAILSGSGCDGGRGVTGPTEEIATLAVGKSAVFDGGVLRIRFVGVAEDSRCPSCCVCLWAGNGRISLEVEDAGGQPLEGELNTDVASGPTMIETGRSEIRLIGLAPYPDDEHQPIPADKYEVTLRVTSDR